MAPMLLPSPALLRQILQYDPADGSLTWRFRGRGFFESDAEFKRWNNRYAGQPALSHVTKDGYHRGAIFYRLIFAHRVVFAMQHNRWPVGPLDHIDGDPANNRIANLRECSLQENNKNQKRYFTNSSGHTGVTWDKRSGKWCARIGDAGRLKNLGRFALLADAVAARETAEAALGYHVNHGRSK